MKIQVNHFSPANSNDQELDHFNFAVPAVRIQMSLDLLRKITETYINNESQPIKS